MIDRCPLLSKPRPIEVSCLLIPYYFPFHFLNWFEIYLCYFVDITRD